MKYADSFTYAGHLFSPYGTFTKQEPYMAVRKCLYNIDIVPEEKWSYDDFYKASGATGQKCDIFVCGDILVVPCESGLFAYHRGRIISREEHRDGRSNMCLHQ